MSDLYSQYKKQTGRTPLIVGCNECSAFDCDFHEWVEKKMYYWKRRCEAAEELNRRCTNCIYRLKRNSNMCNLCDYYIKLQSIVKEQEI
jgi:hypothetical protein